MKTLLLILNAVLLWTPISVWGLRFIKKKLTAARQ